MSCPLIGDSAPMRRTLALAGELAATDYRVLIQGETGVGKSELARWMHRRSGRREDRFVPCLGGEVPEGLEATYFFGAVRGAYTDLKADVPGRLEAADGGTVFFDELGDFTLRAQAVILRFLDGGGSSAWARWSPRTLTRG